MTDRILIVGSPAAPRVRALAEGAELVVVMGPEEDVRELRRWCSDLENVMLIFDPLDGTVPWQEGFFTAVYSSRELADLQRVLAPTGRVLAF